MGASNSVLTEDRLKEYQDLTFLTKNEIRSVYSRWKNIVGDNVELEEAVDAKRIMASPELCVNPFRDRICEVFGCREGLMTFEDYLDMMSVFSEAAPVNIKAEYAFRIYDENKDDMLSRSDLRAVIDRLTLGGLTRGIDANGSSLIAESQKLTEGEAEALVDKIMEEADLDQDKQLSYSEFEHVISKTPDFVNSFRIRI